MLPILEYNPPPTACRAYDPNAPRVAESIIELIRSKDRSLRIEHIGSTSIPGCAGKGYIDLLVLYGPSRLEPTKQILDELGFQRQSSRDPFPEDRPMRVGTFVHARVHYPIHAHVVSVDSPEVQVLLSFRNELRCNDELRELYVRDKMRIIENGVLDSVDYSVAKEKFIQSVLDNLNQPLLPIEK